MQTSSHSSQFQVFPRVGTSYLPDLWALSLTSTTCVLYPPSRPSRDIFGYSPRITVAQISNQTCHQTSAQAMVEGSEHHDRPVLGSILARSSLLVNPADSSTFRQSNPAHLYQRSNLHCQRSFLCSLVGNCSLRTRNPPWQVRGRLRVRG